MIAVATAGFFSIIALIVCVTLLDSGVRFYNAAKTIYLVTPSQPIDRSLSRIPVREQQLRTSLSAHPKHSMSVRRFASQADRPAAHSAAA